MTLPRAEVPRGDEVLAFDEVAKTYSTGGSRERRVLAGVCLRIGPGEIVAVAGRSGSGKSTLLHLAAGIEVPTTGRVRLLGQDLGRLSERERTLLRRTGVGLVFQFFHLLPHLSVLDNVLLPVWIRGGGNETRRAQDLLHRVGLADRARDPVEVLSGGEMQRVALSRALLQKPRLLLADEPTGNLDDENGQAVMDLLLSLVREEGSALVYVTHSRELAARADEVWTLVSGLLQRP
jgi:ABC-type lipoprotein export system ATPase subunit